MPWYPDHGTMEQYHSEYKTDLDLERLPSGKFATNRLIMDLGLLAFNVLRVIGQATLAFSEVPLRQPELRRRIRTVVHHIVGCAAKCVRHGVKSNFIWPTTVSISLAVFARGAFSTGRMDGPR